MNASLQQEAKRRQRVLSAQLVRATPFYGYHPGERLFIKIVMCARPGRGGLDAAGAEPGNLTSWAGAQAEPLRREDRFAADAGAPRSCAGTVSAEQSVQPMNRTLHLARSPAAEQRGGGAALAAV